MLGKYYINIRNKRIAYNLEFKRSVTIIRGNSGTGKSTFIRMLKEYIDLGKLSNIKVNTNIPNFLVLSSEKDCDSAITNNLQDCIYFADENISTVKSKCFVDYLKSSGSWLVYITRSECTGYLQYAINEIYSLKSANKGTYFLNTLYRLYNNENDGIIPDVVITEDSRSGLDIIRHILTCKVDTSLGKDNMINKIRDYKLKGFRNIYIIVDGAAYGNQIEKTLLEAINCNIYIFAKESLEYIILGYKYFSKFLTTELVETYNFADSKLYFTWEKYYTKLLSTLCLKYNCAYAKESWNNLSNIFKSKTFLNYMQNQLIDLDTSVKKPLQ